MATRRRFVRTACSAVILSDLVTLGCSGPSVTNLGDDDDAGSPVPTVTPNGNLVTLAIADYPNLTTVDGAAFAYVASLDLTILVVRTGDTTFIAVDGLCTHRNCYVGFQAASDDFYCNCHGARFAADGSVVSGPTSIPLSSFPATFDGTVVTVDISSATA